MPLVTRNCIEDIRRQLNIYDVVSPVISLKRSGKNFVGLSPFNSEKTPSFFILPDKNLFKCFSSGLAGDQFRFIELTEKLTFSEAIEAIANRYNFKLEYEGGAVPRTESRSLRKEILEIHELAADYFHQAFKADNKEARQICQYWTQERKFPLELAGDFKIGYSPREQTGLLENLLKKGYSRDAIDKCGMFFINSGKINPARCRFRFHGRLMIPIRDYQGQVIAFSARQTEMTPTEDPSHKAKYINSPQTPVFTKGNIVFGLERARLHIDEVKKFILVEGQLDAIRCWQHGFKTVVAPQGTSITNEQLRLLKRYADRLDCVLDGDEAGQKAALRLLPLTLATGLETRFFNLAPGEDPDTLLADGNTEDFDRKMESALTEMQFAVSALLPQDNPSARQKAEALEKIFEIVAQTDSEAAQQSYLMETGKLLGLVDMDDRAVYQRFLQFKWRKKRMRASIPLAGASAGKKEKYSGRLTTSEYELLLIAFHNQDLIQHIAEVIDSEWIDSSLIHGRLLARILAEYKEDLWEGIEKIDLLFETEEEKNATYSLMALDPVELGFEDPVDIANMTVKKLLKKYVNTKKKQIYLQSENLPIHSDELRELHKNLKELQRLENNPPLISISTTSSPGSSFI